MIMTREEEIRQASYEYINSDAVRPENMQLAYGDFVNGVQWSDEHPKSPWISVKERLPKKTRELELLEDEHDKVVIVCMRFREAVTAYLDAEEIWRLYPTGHPFYGEITHWMPIPELPKGGEK